MNQQQNRTEKKALLDAIDSVSFAMDELRLYLDTHPDCNEALKFYEDLQGRRHTMLAEYTEGGGDITPYYVNTENGWNWNGAPMPWKVEAN